MNDKSKNKLDPERQMMIRLLQEWLAVTPTSTSGKYCPINQPQAYKTEQFLLTLQGPGVTSEQ